MAAWKCRADSRWACVMFGRSCSQARVRIGPETIDDTRIPKAGRILLVVYPTVVLGGLSILRLLIGREAGYADNPLRQDLWRAGHAHAGVLLLLSLVLLRYVDEAELPSGWKRVARHTAPVAAILLPAAYFLSVMSPSATEPNGLIGLAYLGAVVLIVGFVVLAIGSGEPIPNMIGSATAERRYEHAQSPPTNGEHSLTSSAASIAPGLRPSSVCLAAHPLPLRRLQRPLASIVPRMAGSRVARIDIRLQEDSPTGEPIHVDAPASIRVEETPEGSVRSLEIVNDDGGSTWVRFRVAPLPETLDGIAPGELPLT